jgi:hypothetical protein
MLGGAYLMVNVTDEAFHLVRRFVSLVTCIRVFTVSMGCTKTWAIVLAAVPAQM